LNRIGIEFAVFGKGFWQVPGLIGQGRHCDFDVGSCRQRFYLNGRSFWWMVFEVPKLVKTVLL
jgi:hypothetical protein